MSTIRPHSSPGSGPLGRALVPGLRICGAGYLLKRLLGRGGFSEVWLAWDRKLEREVALKLLPQNLLQDSVLIENLKTETLRARQLVHPSIARVYDFVQDFENVAIVI